jgi:DNA-binding response OmpR family regulator
MGPVPRVIFVDNSLHLIFRTLEAVGGPDTEVKAFNDEKELFEHLDLSTPDVIFLNLDLHPNDGLLLLKELKLRKFERDPFFIIYSEKQDDFVQELALNAGADSFISFHRKSQVMKLFIRNLLRRRTSAIIKDKRALQIDTERFLIYKNGEPVQLPRKEFRLFELLYNGPEKFFTKTEIAVQIWQDEKVAKRRTIDVHIYNIRQYFGKRIIQSQKGKGYRINKRLTG